MIVLCCGTDHVPFETLIGLHLLIQDHSVSLSRNRRGRLWLLRRAVLSTPALKTSARVNTHVIVSTPSTREYTDFYRAVTYACDLDCQDPRDHVYAVLSMVKWGKHEKPILPDYSKSRLGLYFEIMMAIQDIPIPVDGPWTSAIPLWRKGLEIFGLVGLSLQEVVAADATTTDVIEVQQYLPMDLIGQSQTSNIYTMFEDGRWQHGGRPVQPEGSDFGSDKCVEWSSPSPFHCILTDQGRTFLVFVSYKEGSIAAEETEDGNVSILMSEKRLASRAFFGPLALGLVARKQADGQSYIEGLALIYEPRWCVLRFKPSPPDWLFDRVYLKAEDVKDSVRSITSLDGRRIIPSHGKVRTGEQFIRESQGSGSLDF